MGVDGELQALARPSEARATPQRVVRGHDVTSVDVTYLMRIGVILAAESAHYGTGVNSQGVNHE